MLYNNYITPRSVLTKEIVVEEWYVFKHIAIYMFVYSQATLPKWLIFVKTVVYASHLLTKDFFQNPSVHYI